MAKITHPPCFVKSWLFIMLFTLAFFTSCSSEKIDRASSLLTLVEGVLAWSSQDWPSAISAFLKTSERAKELEDTQLSVYALYGLASTYISQLEDAAAFERLSALGEDVPSEILSSLWYQRGILAYRAASYTEAAVFFKKSLEIDSSSLDAKINLELSNRSQKMNDPSLSSAPRPLSDEKGAKHDFDSIFDVVRKKEQDIWKNMEAGQQESSYYDY